MHASEIVASRARPPVHLTDVECDILTRLALQIENSQPGVADLLLAELDRAELHPPGELPSRTVAMNSLVEFIDEKNGKRRSVRLVYPQDADIAAGRISILTPIGAGLIGLREGDVIQWPDRDGDERLLRIEGVAPGPG